MSDAKLSRPICGRAKLFHRLFELPNSLRKCSDIHASLLGGTASPFRDLSGFFGNPARILGNSARILGHYPAVLGGSTRPFIVRSLPLRKLPLLFGERRCCCPLMHHLQLLRFAQPISRWWIIFDL